MGCNVAKKSFEDLDPTILLANTDSLMQELSLIHI